MLALVAERGLGELLELAAQAGVLERPRVEGDLGAVDQQQEVQRLGVLLVGRLRAQPVGGAERGGRGERAARGDGRAPEHPAAGNGWIVDQFLAQRWAPKCVYAQDARLWIT